MRRTLDRESVYRYSLLQDFLLLDEDLLAPDIRRLYLWNDGHALGRSEFTTTMTHLNSYYMCYIEEDRPDIFNFQALQMFIIVEFASDLAYALNVWLTF